VAFAQVTTGVTNHEKPEYGDEENVGVDGVVHELVRHGSEEMVPHEN